MAKPPVPESGRKSDWELTESVFQKLLNWLDCGQNSDGQGYLEIRRRLVTYFECKKCTTAEDLADEALARVARRLEEEGSISSDTPARYCYIVAHFVFLEYLKRPAPQPLNEAYSVLSETIEEDEEAERRLECLRQCMLKLEEQERAMITAYYQEEKRAKIEGRKSLAASMGISGNALTIRACRIRSQLEACIRKCMSGGA